MSGVGFYTSCISVNTIAAYIGLKRCKELFFFVLSFRLYFKLLSRRKSEIWDAGLKNSVVFETFLLHSHRPTLPLAEENLKVIESFCSFSICHRIRYIIIC